MHANIQEGLTDELAGLAASLKTNTLAMEGKLRDRAALLDGTEAALDTSLQRTKASAAKATDIHKRGRTNLCLTCLIMMVIGLTFAGMYMFIRVTRFAGYKAARPALQAAAPTPPLMPQLQPAAADPLLAHEHHYEL